MKRLLVYFGVSAFAVVSGISPIVWAQSSQSATQSAPQPAPPGTAKFDPRNPPTTTIALPFETLFDIAERTRSPIYGIIEANGFVPPYQISTGQVVKLPPLKVHVVQRGEKFESIAQRYSVQTRSLGVFNNLRPPYNLRTGQKIILPAMVQDSLTGLAPQDLVNLLAIEINSGKRVSGSAVNTVVRGSEAAAVNAPKSPPITEALPVFTVPNAPVSPPISPPVSSPPALPKSPPAAVPNTPVRNTPIVSPPTKMANVPNPKQSPPTVAIPKQSPSPPPPPPSAPNVAVVAGRFAWPLQGQILETFGEKPGFRKIDGIEIGANENTPFRAAKDGTVAYVGDRLPGYGWLVLLRHDEGFITAYAYASQIIVKEGDVVRKGQIIGRVGATGRANSPRLLFQIRAGVAPIDPIAHLPRG